MWRRREARYLPQRGHYNMGHIGWLYNAITVIWTAFALVIYLLPPDLLVTPSNMSKYNACCPRFYSSLQACLNYFRLYFTCDGNSGDFGGI